MPRILLPNGKAVYSDKAIPPEQMDDFVKSMMGSSPDPKAGREGILNTVFGAGEDAIGKINEVLDKHPTLARMVRGTPPNPNDPPIIGPGMMEIPGVKKAGAWLANKIDPLDTNKADRGFIRPMLAGMVGPVADIASTGFDPRTAGVKEPPPPILGPEDNIPARASQLVKSYNSPNRLALPPATNPPITGQPMIAGPVGGPGVAAPANVSPDVAAEVAGLKTGGIPSPQASTVNLGELAEQRRIAQLKYGQAGQNPGSSMDVGTVGPYQPNTLPLQSGNTTGGVNPESTGPLGYPLDVVPNRLRPRAAQTDILRGAGMPSEAPPSNPVTFNPEELPPVGPVQQQPNLPDLPSAPIKPSRFAKAPTSNTQAGAPPNSNIPTGAAIPPAANVPSSAPFMDRLADWVNHRSWAGVAGFKNKQEFTGLDNGIQGILDFQKNPTSPQYKPLSDYFNSKRATLLNAGFTFGTKGESYLPQLWDNTPQQISAVFGNKLGTRPTFTMKSVIDDYAEGIARGLKPKFDNISDLAGWYEKTAEKGIADKNFWESMKANGEIVTKKDPTHPVAMDPNKVPVIMTKGGAVNYYTTPEIADKVNNVLGEAWKPLDVASNISSKAKGAAMSVGVPGTGLNPHGFSTMIRGALASKGMIPGAISTLRDMVNPAHGFDTVMSAMKDGTLETAMKSGLTLPSKLYRFQDPNAETSLFTKLGDVASSAFKKPLFDKVIPAAKINQYKDTVAELVKSGIAPKDASKQAADFANIVFDGKNVKALGEDPNFGAALRTIFFAPGYGRSNIDIATNATRAMLNPTNAAGAPYRRMVMNLTGMYIAGNLINKEMSGHYMWENDPMHSFDVQTGATDSKGKNQYIRMFGSAADVPRMLSEAATGFANGQGDIASQMLRNRLSPGVRLADQLAVQNENWKGDKILGKDKYNRPQSTGKQLGNLGSTIADNVLPNSTRAVAGYLDDSMSPEKAATQALGLPISYAALPPSPKTPLVPRVRLK